MLSVDVFFAENSEKAEEMLKKFSDFQRKAEMYYVYHSIQRYTVSAEDTFVPFNFQLF